MDVTRSMELITSTFLSKSVARDRLLRLMQYALKFRSGVTRDDVAAARFGNTESAILSARQFFRLFKSLENMLTMHVMLTDSRRADTLPVRQRLEKLLQVVSQLGYFFFFLVDNLVVLAKHQLLQFNAVTLRRVASAGWMVSSISGLALDLSKLLRSFHSETAAAAAAAQSLASHTRPAEGDDSDAGDSDSTVTVDVGVVVAGARREVALNALRNLLDTYVGYSLMSSVEFNRTQRTLMGACGVCTASVQLYQIYTTITTDVTLAVRQNVPFDCDGDTSSESASTPDSESGQQHIKRE